MKRLFILSLILLFISNLQAQAENTNYDVVEVQSTIKCVHHKYGETNKVSSNIYKYFIQNSKDDGFFYNLSAIGFIEKVRLPVSFDESLKQIGQQNYVYCIKFKSI